MTTIVDTDSLIALVIEGDILHAKSQTIHQRLAEQGVKVYLLTSTLGEFVSLCTNKVGVASTQQAVQTFMRTYTVAHVDEDIVQKALPLYYTQTSKENSLFDCYVMAAAQQLAVDCIFSFDGGYKQNGFTLMEDFLSKETV
jgi:predicted nucleic acid-binding protein